MLSPRLVSSGTGAGGGVCPLKGGGRVFCPGCPGGGGGRGGLVLPRILVTCPGSQGTSCPCSPFMIRVEVPGSSFMLCLGPGPSSLLHLTRANAEKPYAGDTHRHILYSSGKYTLVKYLLEVSECTLYSSYLEKILPCTIITNVYISA